MMAGNQVYVDLKLQITTYGSHNGMIIHSGVQHNCGKASSTAGIWPYTTYVRPTVPQAVQFTDTQLAVQDKCSEPIIDAQSPINNRPASSPASAMFSFDSLDSLPDDFIKSNNVQLNVFRTEQPESSRHPNYSYYDSKAVDDLTVIAAADQSSSHSLQLQNPRAQDYANAIMNCTTKSFWPKSQECNQRDSRGYSSHLNSSPAQAHGNLQSNVNISSMHEAENRKPSQRYRNDMYPSNYYNENSKTSQRSLQANEHDEYRSPLGSSKQCNSHRDHQSRLSHSSSRLNGKVRSTRSGSIPREAKSEEIFHLYQTRDALGNIRYECEDDFSGSDIGMELIKTDDNPKEPFYQYDHGTEPKTLFLEENRADIREVQRRAKQIPPPMRLPTYEELIPPTKKNMALPKYSDIDSKEPQVMQTAVLKDEESQNHSVNNRNTTQKWLTETFIFSDDDQKNNCEEHCEKSGFSTDNATLPVSTIDLNAVPSKPILQCYRRPSRKSSRRKSVRFPPAQPKVVAEDHRLLITELDLNEDGN